MTSSGSRRRQPTIRRSAAAHTTAGGSGCRTARSMATNEVMLTPEQGPLGIDEALARGGAPPDIVIDLGASGTQIAIGGRFVPGQRLKSRSTGRERLIVAPPPQPDRRRAGRAASGVTVAVARVSGQARLRLRRAARPAGARLPATVVLPPTPAERSTCGIQSPIAIVGNSLASKTTTVAALMQELGRHGPRRSDVRIVCAHGAHVERHSQGVRSLRAGERRGDDRRWPVPSAARVLDGAAGRRAGDCARPRCRRRGPNGPRPAAQVRAHVLWADVVLFLYNPEESPALGCSIRAGSERRADRRVQRPRSDRLQPISTGRRGGLT